MGSLVESKGERVSEPIVELTLWIWTKSLSFVPQKLVSDDQVVDVELTITSECASSRRTHQIIEVAQGCILERFLEQIVEVARVSVPQHCFSLRERR